MTNQEQYELICEKAKKYDRLVGVLDKIRTEIEDIDTNYYSSVNGVDMTECADDMKHGILEIIDKYTGEKER